MKKPLRSFYSLNEKLVRDLALELGVKLGQQKQSVAKIGLTTPIAASYEATSTTPPLAIHDFKVIRKILRALERSGQLRLERPRNNSEFWQEDRHGWYVQEALVATPVVLPIPPRVLGRFKNIETFTVWVCPPVQPVTPLALTEWDALGSVVFLVEELTTLTWPGPYQISGISSLRVLVEGVMAERQISLGELHQLPASEDRFSERVEMSPIEKLESLGGVAGMPRRILTTYKIAYMNDEQGWFHDGQFLRVHDILAYPLFILSD